MNHITKALALLAVVALVGCSSSDSQGDHVDSSSALPGKTTAAIRAFKDRDPDMRRFFDGAHGYAVFPEITKAGIGIGGAHGEGYVYEQGARVGYSEVSQATIGAQLGGQEYAEVIFFETSTALEDFKAGNFEFSGQASAVVAKSGASATADYKNGVAVFTMPLTGAMFEASVGGQDFTYQPLR